MYYVYVLQSLTHKSRYIGSTSNVDKRVKEHNSGRCSYTSGRMPWQLVYHESYESRAEAVQRERFFKTGKGRELLDILKNNHYSGVV